jgi:hypothetical protein
MASRRPRRGPFVVGRRLDPALGALVFGVGPPGPPGSPAGSVRPAGALLACLGPARRALAVFTVRARHAGERSLESPPRSHLQPVALAAHERVEGGHQEHADRQAREEPAHDTVCCGRRHEIQGRRVLPVARRDRPPLLPHQGATHREPPPNLRSHGQRQGDGAPGDRAHQPAPGRGTGHRDLRDRRPRYDDLGSVGLQGGGPSRPPASWPAGALPRQVEMGGEGQHTRIVAADLDRLRIVAAPGGGRRVTAQPRGAAGECHVMPAVLEIAGYL